MVSKSEVIYFWVIVGEKKFFFFWIVCYGERGLKLF